MMPFLILVIPSPPPAPLILLITKYNVVRAAETATSATDPLINLSVGTIDNAISDPERIATDMAMFLIPSVTSRKASAFNFLLKAPRTLLTPSITFEMESMTLLILLIAEEIESNTFKAISTLATSTTF